MDIQVSTVLSSRILQDFQIVLGTVTPVPSLVSFCWESSPSWERQRCLGRLSLRGCRNVRGRERAEWSLNGLHLLWQSTQLDLVDPRTKMIELISYWESQ